MDDDTLTPSLQVLVLAALCFDAGHGAAIAAQVKTTHFDTVYRNFAARILSYRKRMGKPPDAPQLQDIVATLNRDKLSEVIEKKLLPELLSLQEGLNAAYIAGRVADFIRRQTLKAAINAAMDRYQADDEAMPEEVERIFYDALRARGATMAMGTFLDDPSAVRFLDRNEELLSLGIPQLDMLRVGLQTRRQLLYIAAKGSGKTWFCCHCGRQAMLAGWKVLHYSLEMPEEDIVPRYYQTLFGMAEQPERYNRTEIKLDTLDRYVEFVTERLDMRKEIIPKGGKKRTLPRLTFETKDIKKILREKVKEFGSRMGNLVVKDFPTGSLTMATLTSHLDYMAEVEHFIPNLVIVDYPKLMNIDRRDFRLNLGRVMEELRGLAAERNFALVTPHQGTRNTLGAKRVRSKDAGEDISVVHTADTVLAFSRTPAEERHGLGRLSLEHARRSRAGAVILLTQAYEIGQYVLSSAWLENVYWDQLKKVSGDEEDDDGTDDEAE